MSLTATYDSVLSRIRLDATSLGGDATYCNVTRSVDGFATSTTVRGGAEAPVSGGVFALDDYEFPAGIEITYRIESYDGDDVLVETFEDTITQDLDKVWVKVVARPFLNRAVTVFDFGDVERSARTGVFDVVGRSFPVAVSDLRGSRRVTLEVLTETVADATDFDLLLASGEPVFVHVPSTSQVPAGYWTVGDTAERKFDKTTSARRVFTLGLTEVAPPGPDVVGASGTWQSVISEFTTWQDVLDAEATWDDLLELIGDPSEVVVS